MSNKKWRLIAFLSCLSAWFYILKRNWKQLQQDKTTVDLIKPLSPYPAVETWIKKPCVTIICVAWNEAQTITNTLNQLVALTYDPLQIIVCAGGDDKTFQLAQAYQPHIKLLKQLPGDGKQKALERCFPHIQGDVVVFYDGDVLVNQASFEQLIAPIILGTDKVTTGVARPRNNQLNNLFVRHQWAFQEYQQSINPSPHTHSVLGRNFALTNEVLQIAWPQEEARINEDFLIGLTITAHGYPIRYVRDSYVETEYPEQFLTYVRQTNRGLRAHILIGLMLNNRPLVENGIKTIVIGLCGLSLPFLTVFGWIGSYLWFVGWSIVTIQRTRYFLLRNHIENDSMSPFGWGLFKFILASFIAWSWAGIQFLTPSWRTKWM